MTDVTITKHRFGFSNLLGWFKYLLKKEACRQAFQAQVKRERRELMNLNDRELRDIGITREQALYEGTRKPDDLPTNRIASCLSVK